MIHPLGFIVITIILSIGIRLILETLSDKDK